MTSINSLRLSKPVNIYANFPAIEQKTAKTINNHHADCFLFSEGKVDVHSICM